MIINGDEVICCRVNEQVNACKVPESKSEWMQAINIMETKRAAAGSRVLEVNFGESVDLKSASSIESLFDSIERSGLYGVHGLAFNQVRFSKEALEALFERISFSSWFTDLKLNDSFSPREPLADYLIERVREKLERLEICCESADDEKWDVWSLLCELLLDNSQLEKCQIGNFGRVPAKMTERLGEALEACKRLECLKMSDLEFSREEGDFSSFVERISKMSFLKKLSLKTVDITDYKGDLMNWEFSSAYEKLESLSLNGYQNIDPRSFMTIFFCKSLKKLSFIDSEICKDEFLKGLVLQGERELSIFLSRDSQFVNTLEIQSLLWQPKKTIKIELI